MPHNALRVTTSITAVKSSFQTNALFDEGIALFLWKNNIAGKKRKHTAKEKVTTQLTNLLHIHREARDGSVAFFFGPPLLCGSARTVSFASLNRSAE